MKVTHPGRSRTRGGAGTLKPARFGPWPPASRSCRVVPRDTVSDPGRSVPTVRASGLTVKSLPRANPRRRTELPRYAVKLDGKVIGRVETKHLSGARHLFFFAYALHPVTGKAPPRGEHRLRGARRRRPSILARPVSVQSASWPLRRPRGRPPRTARIDLRQTKNSRLFSSPSSSQLTVTFGASSPYA